MNKKQLKVILESHKKWLEGEGGEKANLSGADLSGADLSGADLSGANLYGANLCRADLQEAKLCGVNLCRADLQGAKLCGASMGMVDLEGANLFGANLCGASMEIANLQEAKLFGADLRGVDLYGARLSEKIIQVGPIGYRRDYTIYWVDRDIVKCGCWNDYQGGSLEEFKKWVNKEYPAENEDTLQYRNEYLAVIAMFEGLLYSYVDGSIRDEVARSEE